MKKSLTIIIAYFSISICFAQNYKIEYSITDRDNYTCNSILYVIHNESVYKVQDTRVGGVSQNVDDDSIEMIYNDVNSKIIFSNKTISTVRIPFFKDEIVYTDLQNKIKLKLTGQEKKINNLDCQEGKIELNGRKYIIWFAPSINVGFGPYKINGIPGLIVSLTENTNKLKITLKKFQKSNDSKEFTRLKKYILSKKDLTYSEYENKAVKTICNKKRKEIAIASEYNATVNYSKDQLAFTKYLVDVPVNLVSELQKIN